MATILKSTVNQKIMGRYTQEHIAHTEKLREETATLKNVFKELIYPSREYLNYFLEYFPDWDNKTGRSRIRSYWNGQSASAEFIQMLKTVIQKTK